MRTTACTVLCLTALALAPALARQTPPPVSAPPSPAPPAPGTTQFSQRLQNIIQRAGSDSHAEAPLTRFNLDFPGGTPKDLVAAIEKAMGRPLNAIIPEEIASTRLPALKMSGVTVAQLFQALTAASRRTQAVINRGGGFGTIST
ncbi:MAG TPA: hypothetical protein VMU04_03650 [Candidatus Acidoferrum sp.]|nr:hypothetical protein [Candidatus Acidoferrum sp.]